jgi:hypothetical protein
VQIAAAQIRFKVRVVDNASPLLFEGSFQHIEQRNDPN